MQNETRSVFHPFWRKLNFVFIIIFILGFMFPFPGLSYAFSNGEIYNKEAQNIVNTADLIIKAEHAYSQNIGSGEFTGLLNLEREKPPYLSHMAVYSYNNSECVRKILMQGKVYICVNSTDAKLNIFMPADLASLDLVVREISKGVTGQRDRIYDNKGMPAISLGLDSHSLSPTSIGNRISPIGSANVSLNANGGTTYTNTNCKRGNNIIARIETVIVNLFVSALSLF